MKKVIALLICIISLFCFTSCGKTVKLNDMAKFGEKSTAVQAKAWVNNLTNRKNPEKNNWYDFKMDFEIEERDEGSKAKVEYLIEATFLQTDNREDFLCKMSVDFEYKESYEMNGEAQSNLTKVKMDIICIGETAYAEVEVKITENDGNEKLTSNESAKIKSTINESEEFFIGFFEALDVVSIDYLQYTLEGFDYYYLNDNYFGAKRIEGDRVSIYFEFEDGTSLITEAGYKEKVKMNSEGKYDISVFLSICEHISVEIPKDADLYEIGEIPEFVVLS